MLSRVASRSSSVRAAKSRQVSMFLCSRTAALPSTHSGRRIAFKASRRPFLFAQSDALFDDDWLAAARQTRSFACSDGAIDKMGRLWITHRPRLRSP
jgi:hypothetical protein